MSRERILAVDDEEDILDLVLFNLSKDGYEVEGAISGEEAISKAKANLPDLILLDLMLPGIDGLEVCRKLKADTSTADIPIIMLTAKGEDIDIVTGLELGAEDYVVKPFSPKVLIARIRTVLRRQSRPMPEENSVIQIGDLKINPTRHEVTLGDEKIDLTATEFDILKYLAKRPGWVFTRNQIIEGVKGGDYPVTERSVDVQVVAIRKKLGVVGSIIETVRGVGYRFKE